MFVFVVNRLDAAMERERLLALEKEKAKEEAKKRYIFCKNLMVENHFLKL